MNRFLQNIGLGKIFLTILTTILALLLVIVTLGVKQYFLYRHCEQIVFQSNKLLFDFTSLKEHISNTLLAGKKIDIGPLHRELQDLDKDLKIIIDDILIPEELKLSFISQVDLLNLVVQLRSLQGEDGNTTEKINKLSESLRLINGRLQKFDALLGAHTRSLLFGLHRVVAGTLALVLVAVVSILLLVYRFISNPINLLSRNLENMVDYRQDPEQALQEKVASLDWITRRVNGCIGLQKRIYNLQACLDNLHQTLPGPLQNEKDWESLCLTLQTNPDYFLVWAGTIKKGEKEISVIGCGCESCSSSQCRETVDHLIKYCHQDDGLCQSARQAMEKGSMVTGIVPASSVPDILHSSIPTGTDTIYTASFPMTGTRKEPAIITLYSVTPQCFSKTEIGILRFIFHRFALESGQMPSGREVATAENTALYQYSVIGALTDDIANELTNITNGALNYSQALLDLAEEKKSEGEERMLLAKLREEEHKVTTLAATMQKLAMHSASSTENIHLPSLIEECLAVFRGILKRENVIVEEEVGKKIPKLHFAKGELQAVFFTLLHYSIAAAKANREENVPQRVRITARLDADNKKISLSFTPCRFGKEDGKQIQGPWPNQLTCREILAQKGGDLLMHGKETGLSACSILLPTDTEKT